MQKSFLLITASLSGVLLLHPGFAAEIEATTRDDKTVILHDDGTWEYKKTEASAKAKLDSAESLATKPADATEVFKSKKGFYELWYNPTKWQKPKADKNESAEFELTHSSGDLNAMVIAERLAMPLENLKAMALENAKSVAPDAKIVSKEEREVNGVKILNVRIDGTVSGVPFTYYSYYWTGKAGILQLVTFTGQNLFDEYKQDATDLLNGLVITKP